MHNEYHYRCSHVFVCFLLSTKFEVLHYVIVTIIFLRRLMCMGMKTENTNIFGPTLQGSLNLDSFYLYKTDFLCILCIPQHHYPMKTQKWDLLICLLKDNSPLFKLNHLSTCQRAQLFFFFFFPSSCLPTLSLPTRLFSLIRV